MYIKLTTMELYEPIDINHLMLLLKEPLAKVDKETKGRLCAIKQHIEPYNDIPCLKVSYDYTKPLRGHKIGRMYPHSMSAAMLPKPIRNLVFEGGYSLDIVNCHYCLALKLAQDWHVPHEAIEEYVSNRDAKLQEITDRYNMPRDDAKEMYLKLAFGGHTSIDNEFCKKLKEEMDILAAVCYTKYPQWHNVKFKKDKDALMDHDNKTYSLLSYVLQTEETKIMQVIITRLQELGDWVGMYLFDGLYLKKTNTHYAQVREELQEMVHDKTGYKIKLKYDGIKKDVTIFSLPSASSQEKEDDYPIDLFAETHFMILGKLFIEFPGTGRRPELIDAARSYCEEFGPKYWANVQRHLPLDRRYKYFNFEPYNGHTNQYDRNAYNLFKGFAFEKHFPEFDRTQQKDWHQYCTKIAQSLQTEEMSLWKTSMTYKQLSQYICNGSHEAEMYVMQYMARIVFMPHYRIGKMMIFRNNCGGTGKTAFFHLLFVQQVLGKQYGGTHSSLNEVFGEKNMNIENKLLLVLEESDVSQTKDLQGKIKEAVDRDENHVRLLYHNPYPTKNTVNYILNTNKEIGIVFEKDNMRRFPVFDVKEHRLSPEEIEQLQNETRSPEFVKIFVKVLLSAHSMTFNFNQFPKSETCEILKIKHKDPVAQFIHFLFVEWNDYLRDTVPSKLGGNYTWHMTKDTGDFKVKEFKHSMEEIYDIYKVFSAMRLPSRKVLEFNSFIHSDSWIKFKAKYNIKSERGIYTVNYKDLRQRMVSDMNGANLTNHFAPSDGASSSKKQRTNE